MRKIPLLTLLILLVAYPGAASQAAPASQERREGTFRARALPLPLVDPDIYYPRKASCLGGVAGINHVAESFEAPAAGKLRLSASGFAGDWDLYVVDMDGKRLAQSEGDQVVGSDDAEEQLSVRLARGTQVEMVACNWLGQPELEVNFEFEVSREIHKAPGVQQAGISVTAGGGPAALLWRWDPASVQIAAGDKVVWENPTGVTHHVTAYAGPWKSSLHVDADGGIARKRFTRPGTYSYLCDVPTHSEIVGGTCVGMCGEIVVAPAHRS